MDWTRLPDSVVSLYAEAMEQARLLERVEILEGAAPGSLISKQVGESSYLYWQVALGSRKWQYYLGPDNAHQRAEIDELLRRRREIEDERAKLRRMGEMLLRGGFEKEASPVSMALRLLADIGLFRRGAVLVGTQSFRAFANVFGVRLSSELGRTQDIDIAQRLEIATASEAESMAEPVPSGLARLQFLPVPGLDPREASVSYKVRGRDLRVDFLVGTGAAGDKGRQARGAVRVPGLGISAQPLEGLDYLLAGEIVEALVLSSATSPTLVRLPDPARFALTKLWTARSRPLTEASRSAKDRRQAGLLLRLLEEERPSAVREAKTALRVPMRRVVIEEMARLPALSSG